MGGGWTAFPLHPCHFSHWRAFVQEFRELCASRVLSSDQLEIMSLLNKLHAVQLDNSELQSQLVVRQLGNRRRDLLIDWQHRHDNMARALIRRQRVLITNSQIDRPADLQQLYDIYDKQTHEIASYCRGSFLPAISTNKVRSRSTLIYWIWFSRVLLCLCISQLPNLFGGTPKICNCILLLIVWVRSFSKRLTSVTFVTFAEEKVFIFLILYEKC